MCNSNPLMLQLLTGSSGFCTTASTSTELSIRTLPVHLTICLLTGAPSGLAATTHWTLSPPFPSSKNAILAPCIREFCSEPRIFTSLPTSCSLSSSRRTRFASEV